MGIINQSPCQINAKTNLSSQLYIYQLSIHFFVVVVVVYILVPITIIEHDLYIEDL